MIKSLRFENFKSFLDLEVPEVAPITIIGGNNNVGKTSLLEGIHLFYDLNNPSMFMRHLSWRGVKVISADPNTIVAPIFYDFDSRKSLKIAVHDDAYHATMEVNVDTDAPTPSMRINLADPEASFPLPNVSRPLPASYNFKVDYKIDDREIQSRNFLMERDFANITLRFEPPMRLSFPEQMRKGVFYLEAHTKVSPEDISLFMNIGSEKDISDLLGCLQIVEPSLTRLRAFRGEGDKPVLYADIGTMRGIPVGLTGAAINRLFSIMVTIAAAKDGVVLIDEIDDGIHYSHMTQVWEYLIKIARESNCQIIATTHNFECLLTVYNAIAHTDMTEDFRYIRLDKRDRTRNRTVAKTYPYDILEAAIDAGWEIR